MLLGRIAVRSPITKSCSFGDDFWDTWGTRYDYSVVQHGVEGWLAVNPAEHHPRRRYS